MSSPQPKYCNTFYPCSNFTYPKNHYIPSNNIIDFQSQHFGHISSNKQELKAIISLQQLKGQSISMANVLVTQTYFGKSRLQFIITMLSSNDPQTPTSRIPTNGTPHSPKANVNNLSNFEYPSSNSYDYTRMANIPPLLILKGRITIMDKLKVKVKNMYPQAHACMLAIGLLACVIHRHTKDSNRTMVGVKKKETHPSMR